MIDEEDTIQVVDLVLEAGRQKAVGLQRLLLSVAMFLAVAVAYLFSYSFLKAQLANLGWGGLAIGDHRLTSTQTFGGVLRLEITNLLAIVCTLGLALPWAKVRNHRYRLEHLTFHATGPLVVEAVPAQEAGGATADALGDLGDFDVGFG